MSETRLISILIILIISILIIHIPDSDATTAEVVITLDQSRLEYEYDMNSSNVITISGNVTCNIEGVGKEVHDIEVYLTSGEEKNWPTTIAPTAMLFTESGSKSINLSISVPDSVYNRSENRVTVRGYWETHPSLKGQASSQGIADEDRIEIFILRKSNPHPPTSSTEEPPDEPKEIADVLGWPCIISLIIIPIVIVAIIVGVYYYRKRN